MTPPGVDRQALSEALARVTLFLIVGLENQSAGELNWNLVLLPVGILAIAGAIKLIDVVR